jgi:uncharacterized protein (DUF736 family)
MAYDKPFEPRPNTGTLFANKTKQKETSPDYSGELLIDVRSLVAEGGIAKVRLAGWKKPMKSGGTFLSLSLSNPQTQQAQPEQRQSSSIDDMDDDLPF